MPLKELLRARFATALNSIPGGTWKILITDDHSQSLLDIVYKPGEILQQNVTSIEPLHSPRQPQNLDAIYLLTPTTQNVYRIIADFEGRRTYRSAHIYFIDGVDDGLAQRLTQSLPHDVLKAFVELYCDVLPIEDRVFSVNQPQAFFTMFGTPGGAASQDLAMEGFEDDLKLTSHSLLNVLATINENPYIRYYQPSHHSPLGPLVNAASSSSHQPATLAPSPQQPSQGGQSMRWRSAMGGGGSRVAEPVGDFLSKKIAVQVQNDLDEYMANNPEFPTASGRPKAVLVVVDRSIDPCAPLLHEFWYQAMVNDLLPVKDGVHYKYTYTNTVGGKEARDAELNEKDPVWVSVRHLHMKDAIDTLMTDFGKFAQEHAGFGGGGNVNMNDLKDMLASLPQFQTQREQFSLHLDMAQECMGLFEKKRLATVAGVEQSCATGYTSEGKQPKTIVEEMVPLLDDRNMSPMDKIRIIALYILFRDGVADEDRRRLYQHARLSLSEQDTINNLIYLGAKVIKDPKDRSRETRIKSGKPVVTEGEYELSRYKPVIQLVLEEQNSNRLDQGHFPYIKDAPEAPSPASAGSRHGATLAPPGPGGSLRSARPTWHKAPSARMTNTEGKQRMIIFIAGGVTYSEMRLAYTLGQSLGKDIFIGSTHIITPERFCKDLKSLGRGGIGSNPPNGYPEHPGNPGRPPNRAPGRATVLQAILDRRYWVPPVGPPSLAPPPPPQGQHPQQGQGHRANQHSSTSANMSSMTNRMSDMTLTSSKDSRNSYGRKSDLGANGNDLSGGKDKKEKKGLFKMKW